jgi:putative protease
MQRKNIDLMAPVGSYESLMAAIQAGANSVYFGIEKLNMRARSSNNFTFEDLKNIVNICNEAGVKTYLTVNTIIYDHELEKMRQVVDAAAESKVTAIIASDISVMQYARKKGVEVHASTQLNISNIEAVEFYSNFCDVMVTARELTLDQVADITYQIKKRNITGPSGNLVQIEIFCHGALCMAVSGKCHLSLHEYYHSANRGSCLQNCRRPYILTDKETGAEIEVDNEYLMSPKDLCTIGFIDKIIDAGVSVLKIEGRARSGEYVKTVVECYNEAINSVLDQTYSLEKIENWTQRLSTVFNRGFWMVITLDKSLANGLNNTDQKQAKQKYIWVKCSTILATTELPNLELIPAKSLALATKFLFLGPTTGVVQQFVKELRKDLVPVQKVEQHNFFRCKPKALLGAPTNLYKLVDTELLKKRKREEG